MLRAFDERQRSIIAARDVSGMDRIAHPNLRINAPTNQILSREQLLAMMESGAIAGENFVRVPESVTITGNIGIVMGHESFTPTPDSASGRMFGTQPLRRRYTNVYVRERDGWRFLARTPTSFPGLLAKLKRDRRFARPLNPKRTRRSGTNAWLGPVWTLEKGASARAEAPFPWPRSGGARCRCARHPMAPAWCRSSASSIALKRLLSNNSATSGSIFSNDLGRRALNAKRNGRTGVFCMKKII